MVSPTYCPLPFTHLITNNNGTVSPCCVSDELYRDTNGRAFMMDRDGIMAVWQSEHINDLRQALANGRRHAACDNCWRLEDRGLDSHRLKQLRQSPRRSCADLDHDAPRPLPHPSFITVRFGNTCNLKCRICGPGSSSKWIEESNSYYGNDWLGDQQRRLSALGNHVQRNRIMRWSEDNDRFWSEFESLLPHTTELMFTGGEPWLIPQQLETLRRCAQGPHAAGIDLMFHTNGTSIPRDVISQVLPRFRTVSLNFSTDGTGEQFEYQRHGADWHVVDSTMRHCKSVWNTPDGPRGWIGVNLTVSAMNILYLREYADYFNEIGIDVGLNIVVDLPDLDPANLPWHVRQAILSHLKSADPAQLSCFVTGTPWEQILDLLRGEPRMESCQPFVDSMRRMDAYRGEDYGKIFPEMAALIGYETP